MDLADRIMNGADGDIAGVSGRPQHCAIVPGLEYLGDDKVDVRVGYNLYTAWLGETRTDAYVFDPITGRPTPVLRPQMELVEAVRERNGAEERMGGLRHAARMGLSEGLGYLRNQIGEIPGLDDSFGAEWREKVQVGKCNIDIDGNVRGRLMMTPSECYIGNFSDLLSARIREYADWAIGEREKRE